MWKTAEIQALDADGFRALADGHLPALRISAFATPDECTSLSDQLLSESLRTNSIPTVTRLGISQYQQGIRDSKDAYLDLAAELRPQFDKIFEASFDPTSRAIEHLRALGLDADIMAEPDGRQYWAGTAKLRTGETPVHVDFAAQDSPGWAVETAVAQLAWVLYLQVGEGGELRLWDHCWEPHMDVHQSPGHYAYDPIVVEGADSLDLKPVVGDVVLLNSRYFHTVTHTGNRLAFGSFVSVFADGRARLWS